MALVKFPVTSKYRGVYYPPYTEYLVNDNDVDELVLSGAFVIDEGKSHKAKVVETADDENESDHDDVNDDVEELNDSQLARMSIAKLREYANLRGVDLGEVELKAEIIALIKASY